VVELSERTPCAGLVPVTAGTLRLTEAAWGPITALAPCKGRAGALGAALAQAHGLGWPGPGQVIAARGGARVMWFGLDLALLLGVAPAPGLAEHAALSDQSDAWAVLHLEGPGAEAVLARLTPLDLRPAVFGPGATARSDLGHMQAAITRTGPQGFEIMAFRSMAETLVHEIAQAMRRVAARHDHAARGNDSGTVLP